MSNQVIRPGDKEVVFDALLVNEARRNLPRLFCELFALKFSARGDSPCESLGNESLLAAENTIAAEAEKNVKRWFPNRKLTRYKKYRDMIRKADGEGWFLPLCEAIRNVLIIKVDFFF